MSEDVYKLVTVLGESYIVTGEITIGRSKSCKILIQDSQVSRHHATVWEEDEKLFVRDEDSSNGTFVNDERIETEVELKDGDKIKIGNMIITVHAPYTEAKTQMAPEPQIAAEPKPAPKSKAKAEPTPEKPPEEKEGEKKSSLLPLGLGLGGCLVLLCIGLICITAGYFLFFSDIKRWDMNFQR